MTKKQKFKTTDKQPNNRQNTYTWESRIQSQKNDAGVGQHAADYDQVVQLWTGHLDVPLVPVLYVEPEEHGGHDYAAHRQGRQDRVDSFVNASVFDDAQRSVFWGISKMFNSSRSL